MTRPGAARGRGARSGPHRRSPDPLPQNGWGRGSAGGEVCGDRRETAPVHRMAPVGQDVGEGLSGMAVQEDVGVGQAQAEGGIVDDEVVEERQIQVDGHGRGGIGGARRVAKAPQLGFEGPQGLELELGGRESGFEEEGGVEVGGASIRASRRRHVLALVDGRHRHDAAETRQAGDGMAQVAAGLVVGAQEDGGAGGGGHGGKDSRCLEERDVRSRHSQRVRTIRRSISWGGMNHGATHGLTLAGGT